tara:strand:+ start:457 stop:861 length:405 start_codon:yes stop_codon:yes gene_type:complete
MNEANTAIAKKIYDYFESGDINGILKIVTEDTLWDHRAAGAPDSPMNKEFHGKEGVVAFFKTIKETQEVLDHDVIDFVASDDKVVATGFFRARVKATGKEISSNWAHVWTMREGLVSAFKVYYDATAVALAFQS